MTIFEFWVRTQFAVFNKFKIWKMLCKKMRHCIYAAPSRRTTQTHLRRMDKTCVNFLSTEFAANDGRMELEVCSTSRMI